MRPSLRGSARVAARIVGLLATCIASVAGAVSPATSPEVDARARAEVVKALAAALAEGYASVEQGQAVARVLRKKQSSGAYDRLTSGAALAQKLTQDMRTVVNDKHLRVNFVGQQQAPSSLSQQPPAQMRGLNAGIAQARILEGNIGYLEVNGFAPLPVARETVAGAFAFLRNTDALIIDARGNGGGDPHTVALYVSYLSDGPPYVVNRIHWREGGRTEEITTTDVGAASYGATRPVFYVTSPRTFSGGEELGYDLKALQRATLVGETTGGGANPGDFRQLGHGFSLLLPGGYVVNPVTGTNWEGVGVSPEVTVSADQALVEAQRLAVERLLAKATDLRQRDVLRALASELDTAAGATARFETTTPNRLADAQLVGQYTVGDLPGPEVTAEGGRLYIALNTPNTPRTGLVSLGNDRYRLEGYPADFTVSFVASAAGQIELTAYLARWPPTVAHKPATPTAESGSMCAAYQKSSVMVEMRDRVRLYTELYLPKQPASGKTGILLDRTPYMTQDPIESCPARVAALFDELWRDGYIVVRQAIRGRYRSEGVFVLGAPLRHFQDPHATDEATDAWDTVDWLVHHIPGNNGRVALLGISYDAKLALMAASDPHPAVVAVSAQASPIDQWLGDDFWRNGAFRLNYSFEHAARLELSRDEQPFAFDVADTFEWYLRLGSLQHVNQDYFHGRSGFWNDQLRHRTYDEYWQARNLAPYVRKIRIPVLSTGGWWDAEDRYGSLEIAKIVEAGRDRPGNSRFKPVNPATLVVGPWTHGSWTNPRGVSGRTLGDLDFGSDTAAHWRTEVERPWLAHWLLSGPDPRLPAVLSFRTGANQWVRYDRWPPPVARGPQSFYLTCDGRIDFELPATATCVRSYVSDPADPIPYLPRPIGPLYGGRDFGGTAYASPWNAWEAHDQRFAASRPDALLFSSAPLVAPIVLTGEARLTVHVATTGTDGDFIVKLLDLYPGIVPGSPQLGGYYLMLDHAVLAGRYLRSFSKGEALIPGKVYELTFRFTGRDHAFLPGHRIALQLQSTLFPVIARNPQTYVDDLFAARDSDYQPARIDLVFGPPAANVLRFPAH